MARPAGEGKRLRLTEKLVERLDCPPDKRRERYLDARMPGLCLVVQHHPKPEEQRKLWYLRRWGHEVALGQWPALTVERARRLAMRWATREELEAELTKRRQTQEEPLLEAALRHHLDHLQAAQRAEGHQREVATVVRRWAAACLVERLDAETVAKMRERTQRWLNDLQQRVSAATRRRYLAHVRAVLTTAQRLWPALLPQHPLAMVPRPHGTEARGVFTLEEAQTLVSEAALATPVGRFVAFLLYTGCRKMEGLFARWDALTEDRFVVREPTPEERAYGYRVKRQQVRQVPLQPELRALLASWERSGAYLWPWQQWRRSATLSRLFRMHLDSVGVPIVGGWTASPRTLHSLRHTHAALLVASGMDGLALQLALGHRSLGMTAHYARLATHYPAELRAWRGELRLRRGAYEKPE